MSDSVTTRPTLAYRLVWLATLLFFAGFYALLVPLPRYLERAGLPDWQIGLVLGGFGVASLLGRAPAGVAVDRWGAPRVLLVGAAALLIGALGVGLTTALVPLMLLRILQAVGYVGFTTAGTALVIAMTPEALRGRRLAFFGVAANVAITLTPALVSALLTRVPLEAGFWLAGGLAVLAASLTVPLWRPGAARVSVATAPAGWQFPRHLWPTMLLSGLYGAGFAAFFQFAPILAERRGGIDAGLLYTVYGIAIILSRLIGGRWLDRIGVGPALLTSSLLTVTGLGLASLASAAIGLGAAAFLIAAGGGIFHPVLIAHLASQLPGAPGRATAAFYLGFDLGIGLGSWVFGSMLQLAGLLGLYASAALIVTLGLPLIPVLMRQARRGPPADQTTRQAARRADA